MLGHLYVVRTSFAVADRPRKIVMSIYQRSCSQDPECLFQMDVLSGHSCRKSGSQNEETDRSILNRQRRNAVEERVDGVTATFPHGSQIAEITLEEDERLRVSADDLPDFYHTLGVSYARALTNVFGPWLSAEQARTCCPRAWAALAEE